MRNPISLISNLSQTFYYIVPNRRALSITTQVYSIQELLLLTFGKKIIPLLVISNVFITK